MPIVHITLVEGRDDVAVERCMRRVAESVAETLDAPIDTVRVVVNEVPPQHFAVGTRRKGEA